MSNPLRSPDPDDQFPPAKLINESESGTRHPGRFETRSSIPNTQLVRLDATRVYRNAALSVATGAAVTWDSKSFDATGLWDGSTQFIIPATGKVSGIWKAHAQVWWPGSGAGTLRQIEIQRNGVATTRIQGPATTTSQDIEDDFFDLNRNDIFTIVLVHDAGGTLALTVGSDKCFFSLTHVG